MGEKNRPKHVELIRSKYIKIVASFCLSIVINSYGDWRYNPDTRLERLTNFDKTSDRKCGLLITFIDRCHDKTILKMQAASMEMILTGHTP